MFRRSGRDRGASGVKERIRTSLFALAALVLLVAAMFGGRAPDDGYRPITTEENVSGLAVLYRWLDEGGVPVRVSESDWFDLLAYASEAPEASAMALGGGDVLLVHTPLRRFVEFDEREALFAWVRAGNRLVVSDFGNEEFAPSRVSSIEGLRRFAPGLVIEDKAANGPPIWALLPDPFATVPDWVLALGGLEDRLLLPAGRHPFTEDVAGSPSSVICTTTCGNSRASSGCRGSLCSSMRRRAPRLPGRARWARGKSSSRCIRRCSPTAPSTAKTTPVWPLRC